VNLVEDAVDLVSSVFLVGRAEKLALRREYSMSIGGRFQARHLGSGLGQQSLSWGRCQSVCGGFERMTTLAVMSEAAWFWKIIEDASGRNVRKEASDFFVDPLDEVLVVVFVSGDIPFANIVGSAGAVNTVDAGLFEEEVLEGFIFLVDLDRVLHMIPAESSDGYVAVLFHVFVLFAEELDVGLRVFTVKGEGNEEVVMNGEIVLLGPEEYLEELTEAGSFFGFSLNFKCICGDVAVFFRFAFEVAPDKVHLGKEKPESDL
jgi:hypothetical protein